MNELVSIIIPVYNVEEYIEACLKSIINQSYEYLDIIVINNGSNDLSGAICQKYNNVDERINYVEHENKGVSAARNKGLNLVKGRYVCFCDADDIYESNYIEQMMHTMKNSKADLVVCGYIQVFNPKRRIKIGIGKTQYVDHEYMIDNMFLSNKIGGYVWNKIFDAEKLKGLYFDEKFQICEDLDFVVRYMEKCKRMYVIPLYLYNYRMRENSAINNIENLFDESQQLKYVVVQEKILNSVCMSEKEKKSIKCGIYMSCVSSLCDYRIARGTNDKIIENLKSKIKQYKSDFLSCNKISVKKKMVVVLNHIFNIRRIKHLLNL